MKVKNKVGFWRGSLWGCLLFLFIVIQSMTVQAENSDTVSLTIETAVLKETGKENYIPLELELLNEEKQKIVLKNCTETIESSDYKAGKSGKYEAEVKEGVIIM